MSINRDGTPTESPKKIKVPAPERKPVRIIQVLPTRGVGLDYYYYHVRSRSAEGEILYVSQNYASKQGAKTAAVREHEGRSKFAYVIEWPNDRTGGTNRETL